VVVSCRARQGAYSGHSPACDRYRNWRSAGARSVRAGLLLLVGAVLSTDADDTLGFVPKQQRGHRHQRLLHPGDSERDLQADWLMLRDTVDDLLAGLADPDGFQAALGALFPAYRIHQVKEKFAGLRYYWEAGEQLTDPADPEPEPRAAGEDDTVWGERWDAWRRRQDEYSQTPEGQARAEDARLRGELAERLVDAAEARASVTCEMCGQEGSMRCTCAPSAWYQTLCDACAAKRGMATVAERNVWWEAEQPRFEARQRARFIDSNAGRSAVVVGTPEQFQASLVDVSYLTSEDKVGELPREVYENLSALGVTYRWSGSSVNAGPVLRD
jgi:hypothetical protein